MASSTPMISASMELFEFSFHLHDSDKTTPFLNVSMAAVWLHMSSYTANDISTLHNRGPDPS